MALDAGFHQALIAAAIFLLAAALFALRTTSSRGEPQSAEPVTGQEAPTGDPVAESQSAPGRRQAQ